MSGSAEIAQHEATFNNPERSLPFFTPIRYKSHGSSQAESSASGSKRSHISGLNEDPSEALDRSSFGDTVRSNDDNDTNGSVSKHLSHRGHGGFLLDSAIHSSRFSRALFPPGHKDADDGKSKGKRRNDAADLIVRKRRLNDSHSIHRSPVGGSPLATELRNDIDVNHAADGTQNVKTPRPIPSKPRDAPTKSHILPHGPLRNNPKPHRPSIAIGFDTDPAQIVNMALSLSEGRRRQVSGLRVMSADIGGRRMTSAGQGPDLRDARHRGSVSQYYNPQRQVTRNMSPSLSSAARASTASPRLNGHSVAFSGVYQQHGNGVVEDAGSTDMLYDVSESTFARVQKAKNYFELQYEHRRLLSHLPPLRRPRSDQPQRTVGETSSEIHGKVYNPLQYARNRKLRFREKTAVHWEDEGWHDVEQVRAWVDAVVAAHKEPLRDPDECIRLPELQFHKSEIDTEEMNDDLEQDSPASGIRVRANEQKSKPRRPRSDWVMSPGDLIADAFWLEQGLNKTKIEDREGNKIYPTFTQFKFTGWSRRTPAHVSTGELSTSAAPPELQPESEDTPIQPPSAVPELPRFTSTSRDRKRKIRGRHRDKLGNSVASSYSSDSDSQTRVQRMRKNLPRSLSKSSSSEDSDDEAGLRGRKQNRRSRRRDMDGLGISTSKLDQKTKHMYDHEIDHRLQVPYRSSQEPSPTTSKPASVFGSASASRTSSRNGFKHMTVSREPHRRSDSTRRSSEQPKRGRLGVDELGRSSVEYDSTAPSSPMASHFPSIAINLSPPPSRSPSPTKKPLQSHLNVFRDRSQSKQQNGVSTTDFANLSSGQISRNSSIDVDQVAPTFPSASRGPSPFSKRHSLPVEDVQPKVSIARTPSTKSKGHKRITTMPTEPSSRIRGIFKGGRIAELVGNEVSRVGDFIWKRDAPHSHSQRRSSSPTSRISSHTADSDEDGRESDGHSLKTSPSGQSGRYPGPNGSSNDQGQSSTTQPRTGSGSSEIPQYHNSNLPSFTSPFQRDREQQEERGKALLTPGASSDHISRQAADHRSAAKSPRLAGLAPPKLDIGGASSPDISSDRHNSDGFGRSINLAGAANASQIFNEAVDGQSSAGLPVSGLAGLKATRSNEPSRDHPVTRRDVARTRALLLSSGIKAREIYRKANSVRDPAPKFLLDAVAANNQRTLKPVAVHVLRKDEHLVAARSFISSLTTQSESFRQAQHRFSTEMCPALHMELQALDDMVENATAPRVRVAVDEAGELSMKLTTTSTLAVKALNDTIDRAMRRRKRGPVRWLRRFGYLLIEWMVVGLLWAIWLIVFMVRIVRSMVGGAWRGARWLLWF